jgi:hypothetical protein
MGAAHFLTRTIERVSAEMSLHAPAYNMKRVISCSVQKRLRRPCGREARAARESLQYVRL